MRRDFWFDSQGKGSIHGCRWEPEGQPRAVVQIVHGIAEFVERYDDFANYLTDHGYLVVAEDHMGHGQSIQGGSTKGYFHGGWFTAVADTWHLLEETRKEFLNIPYILFGHSMGSFMARTILSKYPDSGITAAVISGTGWMPGLPLSAMLALAEVLCKNTDETLANEKLQAMGSAGYLSRIEHVRTQFDWISRDQKIVDAYAAHPLCGFTASTGLLRDMMMGVQYIQRSDSISAMRKDLPVFFIAGGDDPVGNYGKGVRHAAEAFRRAGIKDVSVRVYPLCRHEILNEINRAEIYEDVLEWMEMKIQ